MTTTALGVDLYRIAIHDVIGTPNIQALIDANDPSIVVRGANGAISYVNFSNENLNSLVTDGLEVTGSHALPTPVGTFRLAADWAYVRKFAQTSYGVSVNLRAMTSRSTRHTARASRAGRATRRSAGIGTTSTPRSPTGTVVRIKRRLSARRLALRPTACSISMSSTTGFRTSPSMVG